VLASLLATLATASGCTPSSEHGARAATGEPPSPWFVETGPGGGLDFVHETGATGGLHLPEILGSGAALFDFDGDGKLDLYLPNGNFSLDPPGEHGRPVNRLFRQEPDGTFTDATAAAGLGDPGYGLGVAIGDVDNDGDADVYLTNYGEDRLYRNRGDGTFEDATGPAGIRVAGFSTSAVFCDYDLDGWLDLYVARYVRYDPSQYCHNSAGQRDYCGPKAFNPAPDVLLHNNGNGTFGDVSRRAGLHGVAAAAGLGVVCQDLDDDGWPDFYVANDQYANHLWVNRGDGTFDERALLLGAAYNLEGREEAGMGVVAADLDSDLDLDLFVTNMGGETNTLYRNLGGGVFEDATGGAGLAASSLPYTGFGVVAFDAELDGDLDLAVANGRVFRGPREPGATAERPWSFFAEPNLFYLNRGAGRFEAAAEVAAPFTRPVEVSRGLALGDVDDDGDLDLLLTQAQGPARLVRNVAPRSGHWLSLRAWDPRLNRDTIGARIVVSAGGRQRLGTVATGYSYLSSHDPRAHFGLGQARAVDRVDVVWPGGQRERFDVPGVDRAVVLRRGEGSAP